MKTLTTLYLFVATLFLGGCVDNDFDFSDVNTDNVTIGNDNSVFAAPLGKVDILFDDFFNLVPQYSSSRALKEYTVQTSYGETLTFDNTEWISSDIIDKLTGNGDIQIKITVEGLPENMPTVKFSLKLDELNMFETPQKINAKENSITSIVINDDEIRAIANLRKLEYMFTCEGSVADRTFRYDIQKSHFTVKISILKKGALKL